MLVSLSDEAQGDADAAVDWYIGEGAFIAADDFADELDQALRLLSRFPALGQLSVKGGICEGFATTTGLNSTAACC